MLPFAIFALLITASLTASTFVAEPDLDDETDDDSFDDSDETGNEGGTDGEGETGDDDDTEDDDDTGDEGETEGGDDSATGEPFYLTDSLSISGSDGDDEILFSEDGTLPEENPGNVFIDAAAGDDTILLTGEDGTLDLPYEAFLYDSEVYGGEGADQITLAANNSTVDGGAGDDEIFVKTYSGMTISGGEGNDTISGEQSSSDTSTLYGGAGDDIIDGRDLENFALYGGEGNDTIYVDGFNYGGTGYVLAPDGGEGDDLIVYEGELLHEDDVGYQNPINLLGGAGSDTFSITMDGGVAPSAEYGTATTTNVVTVADFEPGIDVLQIDPTASTEGPGPAATYEDYRLEEDTDDGETRIVLRYTHPTDPDIEAVITVKATGLTAADIQIVSP